MREAENGGEFLRAIVQQTAIRARVISGTEEARLIHLAAAYGIGRPRRDCGRRSTSAAAASRSRAARDPAIEQGRSFKLGVIRLTERFVKSDPIVPRDERKLVRHIDAELGEYLDQIAHAGFDRVIGTSGTILSLGTVVAAERGRSADTPLRNRRVSAKQLHRVRKALTALDLEKRLRVPGLEPRRADLAVAGAILLDEILRRLGAAEITLCDLSLREGLVLDYIARHRKEIAQADRYPDVRRRSVIELAERCNYWPDHAHHVARLATALFNQTRAVHGMTDREREWLEYAALLHDVGVHISYEGHHKHSYYLIRNGDLRGFEPDEIETIALLARYHRGPTPKRRHAGTRSFRRSGGSSSGRSGSDAAACRKPRSQSFSSRSQTSSCTTAAKMPCCSCGRLATPNSSSWAATRHAAPFERAIGKPLRMEVSRQTHVEQSDETPRVSGEAVRGRRNRRLGEDDAARAVGKVVERRRAPRVRHRMELVRPREGGDQDRARRKTRSPR